MKTPVHKIEVYIIEYINQYGIEDAKIVIENAFRDAGVFFGKVETREAGEWHDDHPLNFTDNDHLKTFKKLKKL